MKQSSDNRQARISNRQIFCPQLRGMNHPIIVRSSRPDTYANRRELLRRYALSGNVRNFAIPSTIHQTTPIIHQRSIRYLRNVRFSYIRSTPILPDNPNPCGVAPCYRSSNRQAIVRFANGLPDPEWKSDENLGVTFSFLAPNSIQTIRQHQAGTKLALSRHQVLKPLLEAQLGISPSRDVDATSPTDSRRLMIDLSDNRPVFSRIVRFLSDATMFTVTQKLHLQDKYSLAG
jgi:hypothetical protein